jgi:recombination protein RecA
MVKPFNPDKFRKGITKALPGVAAGFHDPKTWISTGNYCLNYRISGNFNKGIPLGKVACLAGETGSGKSFIAAGSLVREAQKQGIFVVLLDSENALDEQWLQAAGVDTSEDKLLRILVSQVDEVGKILADFTKDYEKDYGSLDEEDRPKVLFIVDSLGMLSDPTAEAQFEKGDMKGDFGRKAKALSALVRATVNRIARWDFGFVATNHTYASQDMFDPDAKISGGMGFIYASSIVIAMGKLKLKEDAEYNKDTKVHGIRSACKVMKSRYAKPFESCKVKIPYDTGIDPYSGLFTMFYEDMGILEKVGNAYKYISPTTNEEVKYFKRAWQANTDGCMDQLMADFPKLKKDANYNIADHATHGDEDSIEIIEEEV